ncbi:hypothetical protein V5O48_002539 [Marasmius crinis-equi]|uniref:Phosphatidate phosphatase APP1 catalytic domain-containing protein n=1 Tax=Marasmius crinis-equi TaxID=585013 RepID=A0ABR3FVG6_9AGAR
MPGRSWRSVAASAASSRLATKLKTYVSQQDFRNSIPNAINRQLGPADSTRTGNKQTWREWAGQKIGRGGGHLGTEKIAIFPGWASRRPREDGRYEVDIFVSGFATVHRGAEVASRSQRTFMRLARGFAALPKLAGGPEDPKDDEQPDLLSTQLTPSTEELLRSVNLPPRPNEMTIEREAEMLDQQFKRLNSPKQGSMDDSESSGSSRSSSPTRDSITSYTPIKEQPDPQGPLAAAAAISDEILRKMHENLETRLLPFWSSVLPGRTVHVKIFAKSSHDSASPGHSHALASRSVQTAADGSFQLVFCIDWEELHQIAFEEKVQEHEFYITAELLPSREPISTAPSSSVDLTYPRSVPTPPPTLNASASTRVTMNNASIRVISDVDDTVKHSDIPGGARSVFRNVFVNELEDLVIPGMGEWFSGMWAKGVRFHYVSNGPFELLPILGDFFKIAGLPPGSIKLRSYAGRSLFSGLLSAPAARKRAGVQDILSAFPHSYFILVGDSGEQDLELYAELGKDNPHQVLAIFIRDTGVGDALEDPTGFRVTMPYEIELQTPYEGAQIEARTPSARSSVSSSHSMSSASGDRRPAPINTKTITPSRSSLNRTPSAAGSITSIGNGNYLRQARFTAEPEALSDNSSCAPISVPYARRTPTTPRGIHEHKYIQSHSGRGEKETRVADEGLQSQGNAAWSYRTEGIQITYRVRGGGHHIG